MKQKLEVLIADDEYQDFIGRFTEKFGNKINFTCVETGIEAVNLVKNGMNYDLILLDYNMPLNGYKTAKIIRAEKEDSKIMGFSVLWTKKEAEELNLFAYGAEKESEEVLYRLIGEM